MAVDGGAVSAGGTARSRGTVHLAPDFCPSWLRPLVDNVAQIPDAYRRRLPPDVLEMVTAAKAKASLHRDDREAAVLVLFSGPESGPPDGGVPDEADLLLTVRASTLRHHAGQAAFPGGASDPVDDGPVATALREAYEETGIDLSRLYPLAALERAFIAPSQFNVVPVLAYSPDPGPVTVVNATETAIVSRVPLRAFINPSNRLMVYRGDLGQPLGRPCVSAEPDAGLGIHRPGDFRGTRRRRLGKAVGHQRHPRTGRRDGAGCRPG